MKRLVDVARIQTVNWLSIFVVPLAVMGSALLLTIVLFAAMGDVAPLEGRTTGALVSIYIMMLVAHVQTMTQVFPFALGMSVTRRAFYGGTALLVLAQAAIFGVALAVLSAIERATGGWGLRIHFFDLPFLAQSNVLAQWLVYVVPFLAVSAMGVFAGVIFKRWGQPGVYTLAIGSILLLGGLAVLVTSQGWWPAVGSFFTGQSTFVLLTVYPLLIALVLGAAGWAAIRRATP
jgi:hypothetical protein